MKWEHTEDVDALHEQGLLSSPRARAGVVSTAVNRLQLAQVEDLSDAAEDLSYVDDLSDVDSPSEHSDSGYGDPSSDYVQSAESSSEGFDVEHSVGNDGKRTSARLRHEAAPYVRTSLSPDAVLRARRNAANQHEGPQVAKRSSGAASGAGETRKNDGVHAAKSVQDVNNKHNLKPRTMAPKPLLPLPQTSKGAKLRTQPSPEDPFRYHRITFYDNGIGHRVSFSKTKRKAGVTALDERTIRESNNNDSPQPKRVRLVPEKTAAPVQVPQTTGSVVEAFSTRTNPVDATRNTATPGASVSNPSGMQGVVQPSVAPHHDEFAPLAAVPGTGTRPPISTTPSRAPGPNGAQGAAGPTVEQVPYNVTLTPKPSFVSRPSNQSPDPREVGSSTKTRPPASVIAKEPIAGDIVGRAGSHPTNTGTSNPAPQIPADSPPVLHSIDPDVRRYLESLGFSPEVYASKLEIVGLKNGAMINATKRFVSEARKDKLEEDLQILAGLSVVESMVLISGLRR